ncbi:MAG: HEAT repeat domain-containing protein [Phaeodactylibacter sp.]|nr:HEAT repeat domain-containing protein [Phaeodactylibacter sp.]
MLHSRDNLHFRMTLFPGMEAALHKFLRKTFDIREGEGRRAILMQFNIFLIISTLLIVKPTVTGLFLSEIGVEQLPVAFLLVAVFAVLISTVYSRFLGQAPLVRIILITLLASILLFVAFGILLKFNVVGGWILFAFYVWVAIFGVLAASQFWILANVVFNIREAKRLFGFIGAGAIAGGIFGGYLTTLTAEWLGSEQLPFVGAGLLLLCVPITISIWNKSVLPTQSKFQRRKRIPKAEQPLQLIRKSAHLTFLAAIIGSSVIVDRLVDYQFSAIAAEKIPDPDELTAFFGFWFSTFNVISLLVQLLLTRRLVGMVGVGTSLFFLPVSIALGAGLLLFFPELWAAIFIKMNDSSLKQSVNKAAVELLSLPIPSKVKNQTKTFIDVVVDSVATGIGGLILIFLVNGLDLSNRSISLMILLLILGWLYFVVRVRKTYLNAFKLSIRKAQQDKEVVLDLKNESVVSDLKSILATGTNSQVLYVLQKLKAQPDPRFAENLLALLGHSSDEIRAEVIRNLYFLKNQRYIEIIQPLVEHPAQEVKIAAFDYLIEHAPEQMDTLMVSYLNHADPDVRLAALIGLAEESRDNLALKEKFELQSRLQQQFKALSDIKEEQVLNLHKRSLLRALGLAKLPIFFPMIESFFEDPNREIVQQAILSAGQTLDPHFIPALTDFLGRANYTGVAATALGTYGAAIIHELSRYSRSDEASMAVLQGVPRIAEQFGTQASADLLFELVEHSNAQVRLAALRSLNKLKIQYPFLNFYEKEVLPLLVNEAHLYQDMLSMLYVQLKARPVDADADRQALREELILLLEQRLDNNLERIFRLLGLKYPPEDVISVFEHLQGPQMDLRTNALEYLDNLLDPGLKKMLIPIVETALLETISDEVVRELKLKIPNEVECYRLLLEKGDDAIKRVVRRLLS